MYIRFIETPTENPLSFELNDNGQMIADEMELEIDDIVKFNKSASLEGK